MHSTHLTMLFANNTMVDVQGKLSKTFLDLNDKITALTSVQSITLRLAAVCVCHLVFKTVKGMGTPVSCVALAGVGDINKSLFDLITYVQ